MKREEKFGTEMNVIKDVIFEGTLLKMINEAIAYLDTQVKEKTYLGSNGTFVTDEEYPKFVRQELIVNAVTHRAYSITGTDIQIKKLAIQKEKLAIESKKKYNADIPNRNIKTTPQGACWKEMNSFILKSDKRERYQKKSKKEITNGNKAFTVFC